MGVVGVGDGALAHFGIQRVQIQQHIVQHRIHAFNVQADGAGFFGHDGVGMGWVFVV